MFDIAGFVLKNIIRAWEKSSDHARKLLVAGFVLQAIGMAFTIYVAIQNMPKESGYVGWLIFSIGFLIVLFIAARQQVSANDAADNEILAVQVKARENPERPEYAWDLARSKLERYLERNLYEVRAIFLLTTLVMLGGFAIVVFGLTRAFSAPADFPVSVVSAASGVLLSFIGGSFLLIYRSVLAQSASYVSIPERINAMGMVVQIASTVRETGEKLKAKTTAALARSLLTMYEPKRPSLARKRAA